MHDARQLVGKKRLVGVSRHDHKGVKDAESAGADYAVVAPVFEVPGKNKPLGVEGFASIAEQTSLSIFALGGIRENNAPQLATTGAHGVAVRSLLYASPEPADAARDMLRILDKFVGH